MITTICGSTAVNNGVLTVGPFPKGSVIRDMHLSLFSTTAADVAIVDIWAVGEDPGNQNPGAIGGESIIAERGGAAKRWSQGDNRIPCNLRFERASYLSAGVGVAGVGPMSCAFSVRVDVPRVI